MSRHAHSNASARSEKRRSLTSANAASDRFTALPNDETLEETVLGMEARGFSVEVVGDLDAARRAVLARIPRGSSVMTNPSVTLQETGIVQAIDNGGPYDSARTRFLALDRATQLQEIKAILVQPEFALGQRPCDHARRNARNRFRPGQPARLLRLGRRARHLRRRCTEARPRLRRGARADLRGHCLALEDARALKAYGQNSRVGKILEIRQEDPGRIHIVLIRRQVGF